MSEPSPGRWQLEIAARRFTPQRGAGPEIWLTGVSHLGEAAYYRALQAHLDAQTLVLFEGVGGDSQPRGSHSQPSSNISPVADTLQSRLAAALGLQFQLETIDYDRNHFQNSDLTVEELRKLLTRTPTESEVATPSAAAWHFDQMIQLMEGESFFSQLLNLGLRWLGTQPRYQALSRFAMMETISQMQGDFESLGALPEAMRNLLEVLVAERNRKVMTDLARGIPALGQRDSVSLFYGAGHMRDLEKRLRLDLKYAPRDEIWFVVMTVDADAAGLSRGELDTTRAMIQSQLKALSPAAVTPP